MKHIAIEPDGEKFKVVMLMSRTELGPKAQEAIKVKPVLPTRGLTEKEANKTAGILDAAFEKHTATLKKR